MNFCTLRVRILPAPSNSVVLQLRLWSEKQDAQIFLPFSLLGWVPSSVTLDGQVIGASQISWDNEAGLLVDIPQGEHRIRFIEKWSMQAPDFYPDDEIDFKDFAVLADWWMNPCSGPGWCQGCDSDQSGTVDLGDFAVAQATFTG